MIPRKDARDLRTIRQKLDADKYASVEMFEADMDLMIDNAIAFNGEDSEVGKLAVVLQNKYQELLGPIRVAAGGGKRKGSERGTPQPAKRQRLG